MVWNMFESSRISYFAHTVFLFILTLYFCVESLQRYPVVSPSCWHAELTSGLSGQLSGSRVAAAGLIPAHLTDGSLIYRR